MAVCQLPELPEPVQRKLALQWDELIEKYGFTGGHLTWHQRERERRADRMTRTWRGEHFSQDYPEFVDPIGVTETVALAKERFGQLAEQYLLLWAAGEDPRSSKITSWLRGILRRVEDDACAPWLAGGAWYSDWSTRACRPGLHKALCTLVSQFVARARALEIQHLENPPVSLLHLLHAGGDVRLARVLQEGEQAVTRSRQTVERLKADHDQRAGSATSGSEPVQANSSGALTLEVPPSPIPQIADETKDSRLVSLSKHDRVIHDELTRVQASVFEQLSNAGIEAEHGTRLRKLYGDSGEALRSRLKRIRTTMGYPASEKIRDVHRSFPPSSAVKRRSGPRS